MVTVTVSGWQDPKHDFNGTEVRLTSPAGLTGKLTAFVNEVHIWCFDANVDAEFIAVDRQSDIDVTLWHIPNEAHRTAFILRWA